MIDWIQIADSARVVAIAWDQESETIYAQFPNGVQWWYSECPERIWEEFSSPTQSKGEYIHRVLNGHPNGRLA